MMLLAVDIGNTRTTYGAYSDAELLATFSHETLKDGGNVTGDFFHQIARIPKPDIVGIASVVPDVTRKTGLFIDAILRNIPIRIIGNTDVPIKNLYRNPFEVGTDRLLGSYAAYERWGKPEQKPLIVIDFGTATTFDCVSKQGEYLGGAIALGIEAGARYLSSIAARLPEVPLEFPPHVLGSNTVESMQSGILYGALEETEGLVRRLAREVFNGDEPLVVSTGGLAGLFSGKTMNIHHFEPYLVLDGIRRILIQ